MNRKFIFLLLILPAFTLVLPAQPICNLHIITLPGNLAAPFKFNFSVNGSDYKLKAGHCLELKINTDSVHMLLRDNRWVKKETIDLHTTVEKDMYVLIKLAKNKEIMKGEFYIAETICRECFDKLKKSCIKELKTN